MIKTVIKRDGKPEKYDSDKIKRVVIAAGLTEDESVALVDRINTWAKKSQESTVASLVIRDQIQKELKKMNEYAARKFAWYEGTKDKN